jgi:hypothetical protein
MKTIDPAQQRASTMQKPPVLHGMTHRLICSAPGVAMTLMLGYISLTLGSALDFLPVIASLIVVVTGFAAPVILTEGWNKPFPAASHLALISIRTKWLLWCLAAACFVIPPLVQLARKL